MSQRLKQHPRHLFLKRLLPFGIVGLSVFAFTVYAAPESAPSPATTAGPPAQAEPLLELPSFEANPTPKNDTPVTLELLPLEEQPDNAATAAAPTAPPPPDSPSAAEIIPEATPVVEAVPSETPVVEAVPAESPPIEAVPAATPPIAAIPEEVPVAGATSAEPASAPTESDPAPVVPTATTEPLATDPPLADLPTASAIPEPASDSPTITPPSEGQETATTSTDAEVEPATAAASQAAALLSPPVNAPVSIANLLNDGWSEGSLMFSAEELQKLQQALLSPKEELIEETKPDESPVTPVKEYAAFHLNSILYHDSEHWSVWINGKKFMPNFPSPMERLQVVNATEDRVELRWRPIRKFRMPEKTSPQLAMEADGAVIITLAPNQTILLSRLQIMEGRAYNREVKNIIAVNARMAEMALRNAQANGEGTGNDSQPPSMEQKDRRNLDRLISQYRNAGIGTNGEQ